MIPALMSLRQYVSQRVVHIVGGGTSVDISKLQHIEGCVVAINNAFLSLPNADVIYWCDSSWGASNHDMMSKHSAKYRFTSRHILPQYVDTTPPSFGQSVVLANTGPDGFDVDMRAVRGDNSGAQVLHLFLHMKPPSIHLHGFDFCKVGEKTHWHYGYGLNMNDAIYDNFATSTGSVIEGFYATHPSAITKIYNHSPYSHISKTIRTCET